MKIPTVKQSLTPKPKMPIVGLITIQTTEMTRSRELSAQPAKPVAKPYTLQKNFRGANAASTPPPLSGRPTGQNKNQRQCSQNKTNESVQAAA